jgi:hypothetical protein
MAKTPSIRDNKKTDHSEDNPEAALWAKCERLHERLLKEEWPLEHMVAAFKDLYDLARDLSSEADDLRQQVISLEEDDAQAMEDAIRDVLHEYSNLVVLRHPLLRKLHDSIAPGGLI